MQYKFTKMQSLGNDFVMLNGVAEQIQISEAIAQHIADRHFGIGCDQILLAETATKNQDDGRQSDYGLRIFNSDGSEVGQCGNGARCFVRYLHDQGLTTKSTVEIETITTRLHLKLNQDETATVGMGVPVFEPGKIPLDMPEQKLDYKIVTELGEIEFSALALGNPHCVISVADVETADVENIGPLLESHSIFPKRANIGFVVQISREELKLRVYERGAGETLGCGSGACAAAVLGIEHGQLESKVKVTLPGGSIWIEWRGGDSEVFLTGPVHHVFQGVIDI